MQAPGGNDFIQFCSDAQLEAFCKSRGISLREGLKRLLAHGVWLERFRRNLGLLSPEAQLRLLDLPVFIAGCGGLGGEMAAHLVQLGAGRLYLCDGDRFEESNLNRQRFCDVSSMHHSKAKVTEAKLKQKTPWGDFIALNMMLTPDNLPELLAPCAIVIDCLDSIGDKKMLEKAAQAAGIAWLHGSVLQHEGFVCLQGMPDGCLERLYPDCPESGAGEILSHAPAGVAAVMTSLFVKWLEHSSYQSPLIHVDLSIPEIEKFDLP